MASPSAARRPKSLVASVVLATRNRGPQLVETVHSILRNPGEEWELIVVDQSHTSAARDALAGAGLIDDARLHYHSTTSTGVSRARNHGMSLSLGQIVMFTDDDCVVPADWIERTWLRFEADPQLDILFGGVITPPTEHGWAFQFQPMEEGEVRLGYKFLCEKFGLGSNMAIRRSAIDVVGFFDEMLGAGARFAPAEDTDYGYRALRLGRRVFASSAPVVTHLGVQRGGHASARLQIGMAAMSAKHIRCGDIGMLRPPLDSIFNFLGQGTLCLLRGRRPSGYRSAGYVLLGLVQSFRQPVDVRTRIYRGQSLEPTQPFGSLGPSANDFLPERRH